MNDTNIDSAVMRVNGAIAHLAGFRKNKLFRLDSVASAIVHANTLLSALSLIYDVFYGDEESRGIINRVAASPLPRPRLSDIAISHPSYIASLKSEDLA